MHQWMRLLKKDYNYLLNNYNGGLEMSGKQRVNPFGIGGAFVQYCVEHKILEVELKENELKYYLTKEGEEKLESQFGIVLTSCAKIKE